MDHPLERDPMDILSSACDLKDRFARMGARLDVQRGDGDLNVIREAGRERFVLRVDDDSVDRVLARDVRPRERHLLLEMRIIASGQTPGWRRFLCGHDEREWFAAAIPEDRPVAKVTEAFEALKPMPVLNAQLRAGVPASRRHRRRNEAFIRQGEWYFVPLPDLDRLWATGSLRDANGNPAVILRDEPLRRGRGKPHTVEEILRVGGELVYVSDVHRSRSVISQSAYRTWKRNHPQAPDPWRPMRRDPTVFARGRVRHRDHATILLRGWHQVFVNTEHQSIAGRNLLFLD